MLQNINVVLSLYSVLFSFLAKEFEKQIRQNYWMGNQFKKFYSFEAVQLQQL